ncbi:MAG: acyl-[ACP]--phospholipid O-acyltransferase [Planctomycetota bacterium]
MDTAKTKLGASFRWFNATQFLGALNDNLFKALMILCVIKLYGETAAGRIISLSQAVFVVPFLIFAAPAGKLADRFSKRNIIVVTKAMEIAVMAAGGLSFMLQKPFLFYVVLFLMSTQSAFFGPSKYGIVPELVSRDHLSRANSFLEMLTYLAIILGTACAPVLSALTSEHYAIASVACLVIAVCGFCVSIAIRHTPATGARSRVSAFLVRDIWLTMRVVRKDKYLLLAVLASAFFLTFGAFSYINLIPYGIEHLGLTKEQGVYLFLLAALGIGCGAYFAGKLSGRNIEFGIVPLGAIFLAVSALILGAGIGGVYTSLFIVFCMGIGAGLFVVPIQSFIQFRSPSRMRGQVLASSSFLGWTGVLAASAISYLFDVLLQFTPGDIFVFLGLITLGLTIITLFVLPDFFVRFLILLLVKLCYRLKVVGIDNVPVEGPALLVSNHASWADAPLIAATQQRRIRFIMQREIYEKSLLRPIFRLMRVIPISANDPPKKILEALREARQAMDEGYLVCIFAEGAMTRSGMMLKFRNGFGRITRGTDYATIPVYLGGTWGSIFSYYRGRIFSRLPNRFPHPVSIHFGEAMEADVSPGRIRQKVCELSCDYFNSLKKSRGSVGNNFVKSARKRRRKKCISDTTGQQLTYGHTLAAALALAARLEKLTKGRKRIGILLPPGVAGILANVAVSMLGKVPVNLNYSGSRQLVVGAIEQAGIKSIISSRTFVEKLGNFNTLQEMILIEDVFSSLTRKDKIRAFLKARFLPCGLLCRPGGFSGDDEATIIFSSGTTGTAKGVMLSHHNIISNVESMRMVFHVRTADHLCGVLPLFHAFGFTATLWFPLLSGLAVTYVANPLDGKAVAQSVREKRCTILIATPSFLLTYVRRATTEDFATLRIVIVGAEKLKKRFREMFEKKFGLRPLEGYGATELSPVVSLNIPDVDMDGVYQIGSKPETAGHPLPGIAVKIVNPETGWPVEFGEQGLLMVKGPSVMLGYLNNPEQTSEVVRNGWYNTGDIAMMDEDGFLTITDRLLRFSKIAGEMVPHVGIEEVYLNGLGTAEQVVAVTSVPDENRGEQIAVLYLKKAGPAEKLHRIISESNVPNIWKPKKDSYILIQEMPMLGSGKVDVGALRKIALEAQKRG